MVENTDIKVNQRIKTNFNLLGSAASLTGTYETMDILFAEGGESFYNYVHWLDLAKDPNLIVLSSIHHYYFDTDDLKYVNTVVNLKQLNHIKNINAFLHSIFQNIRPKSNFIGSFLDNKRQNEFANKNISSQYQVKNNVDPFEYGITSRIPFINTIYNLMDLRPNRLMKRGNVSLLLEENGFKVLDMTELNGLTYFHSQKVRERIINYTV